VGLILASLVLAAPPVICHHFSSLHLSPSRPLWESLTDKGQRSFPARVLFPPVGKLDRVGTNVISVYVERLVTAAAREQAESA